LENALKVKTPLLPNLKTLQKVDESNKKRNQERDFKGNKKRKAENLENPAKRLKVSEKEMAKLKQSQEYVYDQLGLDFSTNYY
jgi:hypothetical protein